MPSAEPSAKEGDEKQEGDTIVVKNVEGNKYWSQQSSPESSPEVEPLVANLLASVNGPQNHLQHLESPEPDEPDDEPSVEQQLKEESTARPVSFRDDDRAPLPGTSEERLLQMPELRPLPWREGVDPASENLVGGDSRRKQIKFGCLLATRGEVQKVPCTTCQNGRGKFSLCIALEGFFKGACASCQLSGGPNRCSIKQQDGEDGSPVGRPPDKNRKSSSNSVKRPSSREGSQPKQVKKRRRTADGVEHGMEVDNAQPQWQQEQPASQVPTPVVQSPWATSQTPQPPRNTLPPMQQASANGSNGFKASIYNPPPTHPPLERHASSGNSPRPAPARRTSSGWAAVNKPPTPQVEQPSSLQIHHSHYMPQPQQSQPPSQPPPSTHGPSHQPPPPPPHHYPPQPVYHQSPYSIPPINHQQPTPVQNTPGYPLSSKQQSTYHPPPPQHHSPYAMPPPIQQLPSNNGLPSYAAAQPSPLSNPGSANAPTFPQVDPAHRDQTLGYSSGGPYIDSLPPSKQRQLYGIVTGIQGGIKHLQSELEILKKALGMEDDPPAGAGYR